MPYKSLAQERYFNANKAKLESQGVNVEEYNTASKGMKLPAKAPRKSKQIAKALMSKWSTSLAVYTGMATGW